MKTEYIKNLDAAAKTVFPSNPFLKLFGLGECTIQIKESNKYDLGLLEHEKTHVNQYHENFLHAIRSTYIKSYRLKIEIEAHVNQAKFYNFTFAECKSMIDSLTNNYDLGYSREYIEAEFKKVFDRN